MASGFAELSNLDALPIDRSLRDNIRSNYQKFLAARIPRAFAISPDGLYFAWSSQGPAPSDSAMDTCQNRAHAPCRFYASTMTWCGHRRDKPIVQMMIANPSHSWPASSARSCAVLVRRGSFGLADGMPLESSTECRNLRKQYVAGVTKCHSESASNFT